MKFSRVVFLFAAVVLAQIALAKDRDKPPPRMSITVRPHPRLMATPDDLARIKKLIADDAMAKKWSQTLLADARRAVDAPAMKYEPAKGIEFARELHRRVTLCALAYRLTGEAKFLHAARRELMNAASFPAWSEPSFLATAETTTAVAIGHDWLFDELSEKERATLRRAIVDKGLRVGLEAYRSGDESWVVATHNWNLVGNAGMIVGALAVYGETDDAGVAPEVLARAKQSIANGLRAFAPDGGWEEGPTYWNYGTRFLGYAVASLRSATGSMQGLDEFPGLDRTGDFRMHLIGPTGKNFNFADSTEAAGDSPQMFALAWAFKRPQYAAFERARSEASPGVFDLVWYQPNDVITKLTAPTGAYFRGRSGVAAFRSSWDSPDATYIAFKGGHNLAHHGHLDLGTFVLDARGERWAVDLGSDRYDLPGYSSRTRFTFYRYSTPGQNTLSLNGGNQSDVAEAPLVAFMNTPSRSHAAADLTDAYGRGAKRVMRGIALLDGRDALVQDELWFDRKARNVSVTWTMHTRAKVELRDRTAILRQNGKTLTATLLYPPDVKFSTSPAAAPMPQNQNEGVTRLQVRFEIAEPTHIAVLFTPGDGEPKVPKLIPVSRWEDGAKIRPRR